LKAACKDYYKVKGDANALWNMALVNLALALAESGNTSKEKMLLAL